MPSDRTISTDAGVKLRFVGLRRKLLVVVTALGMGVYLAVAMATDARQLREALVSLGWVGMSQILLLSLLNYALRYWRWDLYVTQLAHRLPPLQHALYYLSGFTYTISPGKIGEAARALYLRRHGVALSQSLAALFAERLQDLATVLLLAVLVVSSNPRYAPLAAGVAASLVALGAAIASGRLPPLILRSKPAQGAGRSGHWVRSIARLLETSGLLVRPRLLLLGAAAGVLAWCAEGVGFWRICSGLDIHLPLSIAVGTYALALLVGNAAIFMPAGIGGTEIVLTALLTARGAPLSSALIATVLCRLSTLWFAVIVGFIASMLLEFGPARHRVPQTP
jgi:glycosyltransferase 2 family protein